MIGGLQDGNVPSPRTSGAIFGGAGKLIVFSMSDSNQVCLRPPLSQLIAYFNVTTLSTDL